MKHVPYQANEPGGYSPVFLIQKGRYLMLIKAGQLSVRKLETRDRHLLAKWLTDPKVLEFYEGRDNPFNLQRVHEKFYDRDNGVHRNVIVYEGSRIGYIQFYDISDKERRLYGYEDEIVA